MTTFERFPPDWFWIALAVYLAACAVLALTVLLGRGGWGRIGQKRLFLTIIPVLPVAFAACWTQHLAARLRRPRRRTS